MWAWLKRQLDAILHVLFSAVPTFRSLWQKVVDFKTRTLNIFNDIQTLVDGVRHEVEAIRDFQLRPQWKNRVIHVPRAIDAIQRVPAIIEDFVQQIKSLVADLKSRIEPAEVNVEDVEGLERTPAKLLGIGERLLGWATLIIDSLVTIENTIQELNQLVSDIRDFRELLENLDGLFLPQSNPKHSVPDSGSHRTRVP